jgi:anthranilate/para-aminobenzoate synthase component I
LYLSSIALLGLTAYDYVRLEDAFRDIRFERADIKMLHPAVVPEVLILDHVKTKLDFVLYNPRANESESVIRNLVAVNLYSPSADSLLKLITLLELNGRSEEAQIWMRKAPRLLAKVQQDVIPAYWAEQQRIFPQLASRDWVKAD